MAAAFKLWDHDCIIDAYFNQHLSTTEDDRKLQARLRRRRMQSRKMSFDAERKAALTEMFGDTELQKQSASSRHMSTSVRNTDEFKAMSNTMVMKVQNSSELAGTLI